MHDKFLVIGLGSIGQRHVNNLRQLRPDAVIVTADALSGGEYRDWQRMIRDHPEAIGAVIASPTEFHMEQLAALVYLRIPVYVEKPVVAVEHGSMLAELLPAHDEAYWRRCAVGHQYRFAIPGELRTHARQMRQMIFVAQDDLAQRYGPQVEGVMVAHAIDTALWTLGPAQRVRLLSTGYEMGGSIIHEGGTSLYYFNIQRGPRRSQIQVGDLAFDLPAENGMYQAALSAWLDDLVPLEPRDRRSASVSDGLAVVKIMAQVRREMKERGTC